MSKSKITSQPKSSQAKTAAQEALEVTWVLKGHLKNAQISYIRVGSLLARVRDRQLYKALHHDDLDPKSTRPSRFSRTQSPFSGLGWNLSERRKGA